MNDFILATVTLLTSGLLLSWVAALGYSFKEADKAIMTEQVDHISWSSKWIEAPFVIMSVFLLDCHNYMWNGIHMVFSSDYRGDIVMEEILFEDILEEDEDE